MLTLHSLTRRLEKLQAATLARCSDVPDFASVFYDMDNPDQEEIQTQIAQAGKVATLLIMPKVEPLEDSPYVG